MPKARRHRMIHAMRIASLLASGTEIVCALGLEDQLVAISHECDYPPRVLDRPRISRPRFDPRELDSAAVDEAVRQAMTEHGSVYALDTDALRATAPDLVLTQEVCEVCAVPTSLAHQAVRALAPPPAVTSLDAHDVDGIFETILQVGRAAQATAPAETLVQELRRRLAVVRERVRDAPRPRVLALEWLDPAFVPGHWVPQMVELAGGTNLAGARGQRSHEVAWDELRDLNPDLLLVMPCGYGLERSWREACAHAAWLRQVAPDAIDAGRAFVVDGSSYFNRSGPRVVDGVEILGALVHPARVDYVDLAGRAARWRPETDSTSPPTGVRGAGDVQP